ncbi:geranylgeranylglyceryl diphosphate synthase [Ignisphaera aggregans DSM 17230]|uniref:Geranylgeranylglyceryl phosphate synthase n=1 Tax=Ignisphaera aggregans (strain DSM 17230 / JCM 13409 / AQ1.S1) TaxID=583356 RepID=E0SPG8_IGNAA|nr:geranylgeranylglyceryl diphosphate synthase [Ignisphaera aggregans DSM 17230]
MYSMRFRGKVYTYIKREIEDGGKLHFSLVDPEKVLNLEDLRKTLRALVEAGTNAILIGGSLNVFNEDVEKIVDIVEELEVPSILFPGSIAGIAKNADAIMMLSLLNSDDVYFIVGAQAYAAPIIKRLGLEVLPTGYIVVGEAHTSVSIMGRARMIPFDKPEICAAYALAGKYMGMRFIYLEAGSGAPKPVPPEFVRVVKKAIEDTILIVGGGIRSSEVALEIANAGADIIVTGTIIEKDLERAIKIISSLRRK